MNLTLWIVAGLMATVFLFAGSTKLFIPREKLAESLSAADVHLVEGVHDGNARTAA